MAKKVTLIFLNEKEVAFKTGISLGMIRKMRSCPGPDPLPFYKLGANVRYTEADISDWLQRRRVHDTFQAKRIK